VIDIHLNGEVHEIAREIDLLELLRQFALPEKRVAVEVNGSVVSRADWLRTFIGHGDKIEVVHFVGGG
jgi:thiamine biosynthesis protein ThiS